MDELDTAKLELKAVVNDFKENVYPTLAADPARGPKAAATLNAAGLAASESSSIEEVKVARAALEALFPTR